MSTSARWGCVHEFLLRKCRVIQYLGRGTLATGSTRIQHGNNNPFTTIDQARQVSSFGLDKGCILFEVLVNSLSPRRGRGEESFRPKGGTASGRRWLLGPCLAALWEAKESQRESAEGREKSRKRA